jgi:hypothetical protein
MRDSTHIAWLFGLGVPLLLVALFFQTVTLASQQYAGVLITAPCLTALADICFILAFRQGSLLVRCFSVVLLLPTVFVVADFIRRSPNVFE